MDVDTNWCLQCECQFSEGFGPYCSMDCQEWESPPYTEPSEHCDDADDDDEDEDEVIYHRVDDAECYTQWTGNGSAGILAWATEISRHSSEVSSSSSSPVQPRSRSASNTSSPTSTRLPTLLRPKRRPAPPALCVTSPRPAIPEPSRPILTPQQRLAFCSTTSFTDAESMGKTSLLSGATDSSLATPASAHAIPISQKPSILGAIATHVRSWVAPQPIIASPSSSIFHIRPSPATAKQPPNFTVIAHKHHSPALLGFDTPTTRKLSSTIVVAVPRPRHIPRGRTTSRS